MFLTREEEQILAGEFGEGKKKAMELLVALGDIYKAEKLLPITSAHLSGVSYKTIGEGGISFLEEMSKDCRVCVPTTLNPPGMDREKWKGMGISEHFAERQHKIISCYEALGVTSNCSCTPYLDINVPKIGEHVSWAESSALSYVNSVIGAKTNREGGPGALAAAILGKTPEYGLHLAENRAPSIMIDVKASNVNYSVLGQAVGQLGGGRIPYFKGIRPTKDQLKTLAAAMAAAGSVALFYVDGVTPVPADTSETEKVSIDDKELQSVRDKMSSGDDPELIALGCPHLSCEEIHSLASKLKDKTKKGDTEVWFCTSRCTAAKCKKDLDILSKFGNVICDTCMIVTPIEERFKCTAVDSGKACNYLPTLCSQKVVFRDTDDLLEMIQ